MSGIGRRVGRGIGGGLLLWVAAFLGGGACLMSGAHTEMNEIDMDRFVAPGPLIFAAGAVMLTACAGAAGRTGQGAASIVGLLLVPVAALTGIVAMVHSNHGFAGGAGLLATTVALTIAAMVALAWGGGAKT